MPNKYKLTLTAVIAVLMAACSAETPPETSTADDAVVDTGEPAAAAPAKDPAEYIDWFDGTVDEAFAHAKASGRPIYLYWGAEWCPPCHAIKATVFNSQAFIERSKLFVPVYLDGDNENAQFYGEKFGVLGYPTMIVFDASGEEITRIPNGIDIQAYANVLDLTLDSAAPAAALLANLMTGDAPELAARDCTLLAYYSWGQNRTILNDYDEVEAFRRMHAACPESSVIERSLLYMAWLEESLLKAETESVPISAEFRRAALPQYEAIVDNYDAVKANVFSIYDGARYARALSGDDVQSFESLKQKLYAAYDRLAADDTVYIRERIYTLSGKINFERIDDEEAAVSAALSDEIRDMVVWAEAYSQSVYERQPIINALGNVLQDAEMYEVAKPLLLAELERSKQPYYFMNSLSSIEKALGNTDAAMNWLQKAYDASRGPATRFQWGYYYLNGLLEMQPEGTALIQDTVVNLITELNNNGGFYQRTKAQLSRLETKLLEWGDDRPETLQQLREAVIAVCDDDTAAQASRETCNSFLEAA